jgi:hypothetical protein
LNLRVRQWAAGPRKEPNLNFIRILIIGRPLTADAADLKMQWLPWGVELTFFKEYSYRVFDYIHGHPIRGVVANLAEDSRRDYGHNVETREVTDPRKLNDTITEIVNKLRPRRPTRHAA